MDGAEARKKRYSDIAKTIQAALFKAKEQGLDYIPLKKTIVGFKVETGLTVEKIEEYMNDLAELGQFDIDRERNQIKRLGVSV